MRDLAKNPLDTDNRLLALDRNLEIKKGIEDLLREIQQVHGNVKRMQDDYQFNIPAKEELATEEDENPFEVE